MGRNKGLLLDRDGVINVDTGYVHTREAFHFRPGVLSFLRFAVDSGYRLAVVTNQAGVARGYFSEDDHVALSAWMIEALAREGIPLPLVLASFTHRDGVVAPLKRDSFWRKPNPGMMLEAALRLDLDLKRSALIGDSQTDIEAALAAGVGRAFWLSETAQAFAPAVIPTADFTLIQTALTKQVA